MARWDITVVSTSHYHFAIEAKSAGEASAKALMGMVENDPERTEITIETEIGPGE